MKKYLIIVTCLLISSCSTVFNSGSQTVLALPSNPNNEGVLIDVTSPSGSYRTKLPATIVATPSTFSDLVIKVSDRCFERTELNVRKSVTPSYWVNILFWPGFIIDPITGYMWKYDTQTMIPLTPKACK